MFTEFNLFSLFSSLYDSNLISSICFAEVSPSDSHDRRVIISYDFIEYTLCFYQDDLSSFTGNFYQINYKLRCLSVDLDPECYDDFVNFAMRVRLVMLNGED